MNTSFHHPDGAPTKRNPIFRLVVEAEAQGWSEKKALQEALRTKFLAKVRRKHYEEIISYLQSLSYTSTDTYRPLLVKITLQCARRQKIDRELWYDLNLSVGGILLGAAEWSAAEDHFLNAKKSMPPLSPVHLRDQCDIRLMFCQLLTGNVIGMERLFGKETKGVQQFASGRDGWMEALKKAMLETARGDLRKAVEALESIKGNVRLSDDNGELFGWIACFVYSRAQKFEKAIEYLKIPKESLIRRSSPDMRIARAFSMLRVSSRNWPTTPESGGRTVAGLLG